MTRISKAAAWAAAGIVGGGAAAGVAYAAVSAPAAAGQNATTSATAPAQQQPHARAGLGRRALLSHLEHGQLTLQTRKGDRTVDLQRGKVTAVSATSISVASPDGFARTYTVNGTTRVRGANGREPITAVHDGDTVFVIATAGTALRIADR